MTSDGLQKIKNGRTRGNSSDVLQQLVPLWEDWIHPEGTLPVIQIKNVENIKICAKSPNKQQIFPSK